MDFAGATVDECLNYARIAEAAERYVDMCNAMKELVNKKTADNKRLEVEERNLLSVAYKNVVGTKRSSWRTFSVPQNNLELDKDMLAKYKEVVEKELETICLEVVALLKKLLEGESEKKDETTVFYHKMMGDYYRYLSEFITDEKYKELTKQSYEKAMATAKEELAETHPTRLGLALNFSVCHYEILKNPDAACKLAKEAFDAAIEKLDTLNDASYKDSTLIMQLLRDNLTLWTSESDDNAAGTGDDKAVANP